MGELLAVPLMALEMDGPGIAGGLRAAQYVRSGDEDAYRDRVGVATLAALSAGTTVA
jgi:hypothetical protein